MRIVLAFASACLLIPGFSVWAEPVTSGSTPSATITLEEFVDIIYRDDFNTDECEPYGASPQFITIGGEWTEPEQLQFESFTVPAGQRGGGIIDATLTSGLVAEIQPRLFACVSPENCEGEGTIAGHTGNLQDSPDPARIRFQAAPGQLYRFKIEQFGNASPEEYPVDYTLTIDYGDRLDCWEPNNRIEQSRLMQQQQSVIGYMIEGYVDNSLTTGAYADWYRFTLREEEFINIDIPQPAGNHRMSIAVFENRDGTGSVLLEGDDVGGRQPVRGQPFSVNSTRARTPGVYFIRVGLVLQDGSKVEGWDPGLEHWLEEYAMVVSSTDTDPRP